MTENKFENVSSLMDHHQHDDNTIEDVLSDSHLSATWERYHLIGDVMRGDASQHIHLDLSSAINDAIANEPTILAPTRTTVIFNRFKAKVQPLVKPFGQMAIAASAAGLMILGVQHNTMQSPDFLPENQVVKTNPLGGFAQPVSLNFNQSTQSAKKQSLIEQQRRFQALLSDHQQQLKISSASTLAKQVESDTETNINNRNVNDNNTDTIEQ